MAKVPNGPHQPHEQTDAAEHKHEAWALQEGARFTKRQLQGSEFHVAIRHFAYATLRARTLARKT
jgi:hypothetical protein